jgi:hypothetical protein
LAAQARLGCSLEGIGRPAGGLRVGNASHREERSEEVRDHSIPKARSWRTIDEHFV